MKIIDDRSIKQRAKDISVGTNNLEVAHPSRGDYHRKGTYGVTIRSFSKH